MAASLVLGEFEQIVLLGVLHCGDDAYGVPIWRALEARTGRGVSLGAVYKTLDRLETKGFVRSVVAPATPQRGGRSKRVFHVTAGGLRQLRGAIGALTRMTEGLEAVLDPR